MKDSYAVTALLLLAGAAGAEAQRSTPADPSGLVRVVAVSGEVTVRDGTSAEVRVIDRDGDSRRDIDLERRNGEVHIRVHDDRDVEVVVPRQSRVDVLTREGDIQVFGIRGTLYAETLSGDIMVEGALTSVNIESISGDILVDGTTPNIRVSTVSGDVRIDRATGAIKASTTSGDLDITAADAASCELANTSGDVMFSGTLAADAVLDVTNSSGDVILELPDDIDADFDIDSMNGEIRNDLGPGPTRNRWTGGESLRFTNGRGGARIVVRNVGGEIMLEVR